MGSRKQGYRGSTKGDGNAGEKRSQRPHKPRVHTQDEGGIARKEIRRDGLGDQPSHVEVARKQGFSRTPVGGRNKKKKNKPNKGERRGKGQGRPETQVQAPRETTLDSMVTLVDTNFLIKLSDSIEACLRHSKDDNAYNPVELLEALSDAQRTLVIPNSVLVELFPYGDNNGAGASFDAETGKHELFIPEKARKSMNTKKPEKSYGKGQIAHFLNDMADAGEVRYFNDAKDLLKDGALDSGKGGIIILADEKIQPFSGTGKYSTKANAQVADTIINGFVSDARNLGAYKRQTNHHIAIISDDGDVLKPCSAHISKKPSSPANIFPYTSRSFFDAASKIGWIPHEAEEPMLAAGFDNKGWQQSEKQVGFLQRMLSETEAHFSLSEKVTNTASGRGTA